MENKKQNNPEKGVVDPICGMQVDSHNFSAIHNGITYYFCSQGCKDSFKAETEQYEKNTEYDLVIIGAGPAGLTAAVYASILRLHTFLISKDIGGQAVDSTRIKNYMGFDYITGPELVEKFKNQFLHRNYIEHIIDEVTSINPRDKDFNIFDKHDITEIYRENKVGGAKAALRAKQYLSEKRKN